MIRNSLLALRIGTLLALLALCIPVFAPAWLGTQNQFLLGLAFGVLAALNFLLFFSSDFVGRLKEENSDCHGTVQVR